jgi:glycosyltransferase involved in cell wall biosynthesis
MIPMKSAAHTPVVSVIMPTYNRASIILRAIDSVLEQTFTDFELIIIDDGSTDDTREVIVRRSDSRVRVLGQTHKGAAAARNLGIRTASGKYIAYLDTDNIWHKNFLEIMVGEIDDNILIYSSRNLLLCDALNGKPRIIARKVDRPAYNPTELLSRNFIDTNSVLHARGVFKTVEMFDENLKTLQDWDLFTRMAIAFPFKIKHVDQVLCDYYFFTPQAFSTITNTNFEDYQSRIFDQNVDEDTLALRKKFKRIIAKKHK